MEAESSTAASGSKSGTGGATADSYIGSLISLTSKSEIRYEGILYNINTEESSIGLRNVRSFGTEGRKMDGPQVPPRDKVYEYILFRGTDIKDLQVKASPPVQTPPPINNDPAIIQSHYPRPPTPPTNFPAAPSGSSPDLGSQYAQMGLPSSTFQSGLPLYQPGGNMNSWGPSPPNANGTGLPMPMYWPGFHGTPNGVPQLPQQSLLRPPSGLSVPPFMQQMQFSGFNPSLPMPPSSLPNSNLPDYQPSLLPNSTSSFTLTSTYTPPSMQQMHFSGFNPSLPMPSSSIPISNLPNYHSSLVPKSTSFSTLTSTSTPASSFPFNVPPLQPMPLPSETMYNPLQNKFPVPTITASAPNSSFTSLAPLPISVPNDTGLSSVGSKPSAIPSSSALPSLSTSQPVSSVVATSVSVLTETPTPSLVTPRQLLQSGPSVISVPQPLQTTHKDVEVVQVSAKTSPQPSVPVVTETQPPILPLPPNTRAHKPNGGTYHMRNNYRGRGGRGSEISRPVTKFTEEFDFTAMNEKFNKDEVWGHLGKSNKSPSKDKEGYGSDSDEDPHYEYDAELPTVEVKPVYNKDDFFDSLSCNSLDNNTNHGRPRYSEQMKLDTETFGDFSRYRGGRGGGRFRGSYYGRGGGYGGYGYRGRGRGHGKQNRTS